MHQIVIQFATDKTLAPKSAHIRQWAKKALAKHIATAEVTIRIVNVAEMTELNSTYRKKSGPTNVLAFPFAVSEEVEIDIPILGDIIICADIVNQEAEQQGKSREAHWAHMTVHGVFHLLGFDHTTETEAQIMETLEISLLQTLGFDNPYQSEDHVKHYE